VYSPKAQAIAAGSHTVTQPHAANQHSANRIKKMSAPWSRKRPKTLETPRRRASRPSSTSLATTPANSNTAGQRADGVPCAAE